MGNFILETLRVAHVSVCGDVSTLSDAVGKGKSKPIFLFDIWPPWDFLAWWKELAKMHVSKLWTHWKIWREFRMPYQQKCFLRSKVLLWQAFSKYAAWHCTASVWNRLVVQWKKKSAWQDARFRKRASFLRVHKCICCHRSVCFYVYLSTTQPAAERWSTAIIIRGVNGYW